MCKILLFFTVFALGISEISAMEENFDSSSGIDHKYQLSPIVIDTLSSTSNRISTEATNSPEKSLKKEVGITSSLRTSPHIEFVDFLTEGFWKQIKGKYRRENKVFVLYPFLNSSPQDPNQKIAANGGEHFQEKMINSLHVDVHVEERDLSKSHPVAESHILRVEDIDDPKNTLRSEDWSATNKGVHIGILGYLPKRKIYGQESKIYEEERKIYVGFSDNRQKVIFDVNPDLLTGEDYHKKDPETQLLIENILRKRGKIIKIPYNKDTDAKKPCVQLIIDLFDIIATNLKSINEKSAFREFRKIVQEEYKAGSTSEEIGRSNASFTVEYF